MSLDLDCDRCGSPLVGPGALVFSLPRGREVVKHHICGRCWPYIVNVIAGAAPTPADRRES